MWQSVPLVSTGLILAAFVVAAAVTALGFYLKARVKTAARDNPYQITAPKGDRDLVEVAIATDLKRHVWVILLVGFLAALLTAIVLYAIRTAGAAPVPGPSPTPIDPKLRKISALWQQWDVPAFQAEFAHDQITQNESLLEKRRSLRERLAKMNNLYFVPDVKAFRAAREPLLTIWNNDSLREQEVPAPLLQRYADAFNKLSDDWLTVFQHEIQLPCSEVDDYERSSFDVEYRDDVSFVSEILRKGHRIYGRDMGLTIRFQNDDEADANFQDGEVKTAIHHLDDTISTTQQQLTNDENDLSRARSLMDQITLQIRSIDAEAPLIVFTPEGWVIVDGSDKTCDGPVLTLTEISVKANNDPRFPPD
jgi:hypothetical protein